MVTIVKCKMCNVHFCTSYIQLALLTHGTWYNISTISSPSIAPVIGSVAAIALSLSEVQVTVTLSDTGGQAVEEYTVSYMHET